MLRDDFKSMEELIDCFLGFVISSRTGQFQYSRIRYFKKKNKKEKTGITSSRPYANDIFWVTDVHVCGFADFHLKKNCENFGLSWESTL